MLLVNRAFARFDENDENDELAFYTVKRGLYCSDPVKTTKNDENGGCHAGQGMVYQRHGYVSLISHVGFHRAPGERTR